MKLSAQTRTEGQSGALRDQGRLPGIIYNTKVNILVSVESRAFDKAFRTQGISSIIDLEVDGKTHPVLVKSVQMDKRRRVPIHVDFYEVTAGQPVHVHVPLEFTGTPVGVREGGLADYQRREVHLSILPRLIPHSIEVDVSDLAIGSSLHIRDLAQRFPAEATILDDQDLTVVAVVAPRVTEDAEEVADEAEEPEVIGRGGDEGEETASAESDA
jgi:large subunit ribosomal protein L25